MEVRNEPLLDESTRETVTNEVFTRPFKPWLSNANQKVRYLAKSVSKSID